MNNALITFCCSVFAFVAGFALGRWRGYSLLIREREKLIIDAAVHGFCVSRGNERIDPLRFLKK